MKHNMKQRVLAVLITLVLVAGLLPATASAATPLTMLVVEGVDLLVASEEEYPEGVSLNKEEGILTLDDVQLAYSTEAPDGGNYASIISKGDLTIQIEGENAITGMGSPVAGIYAADGALTLTGTGSLTITSVDQGLSGASCSLAIDSRVDLTIAATGAALDGFNNITLTSPSTGNGVQQLFAGDTAADAVSIEPDDLATLRDGYLRAEWYEVSPDKVEDFTMLSGFTSGRFDFDIPEDATLQSLFANDTLLERGYLSDYTYYTSDTYLTLTNDFCRSLRKDGEAFTVVLTFIFKSNGVETGIEVPLIFPETVALTIESDIGGRWIYDMWSSSKDVIYLPANEPVEIRGIAEGLYRFVGWKINGEIDTNALQTFQLTEDTTVELLTEPLDSSLIFEPSTVDFGDVTASESDNPPEAKKVTLRNNGEVPLVLVPKESVGFEVEGLEAFTLLQVGESCEFTVRPKAGLEIGTHDEELVVTGFLYDRPQVQAMSVFSTPMSEDEVFWMPENDEFNDFSTQATLTAIYTVKEDGHTHDWSTDWSKDDNNHWHECSICDEKKDEAAHTFEWVIDKPATETLAGSKHEECTVCGYAKAAVEIPATGTGASDLPKTGDDSSALLWTALLLTSGAGLAGAYLFTRKRKYC